MLRRLFSGLVAGLGVFVLIGSVTVNPSTGSADRVPSPKGVAIAPAAASPSAGSSIAPTAAPTVSVGPSASPWAPISTSAPYGAPQIAAQQSPISIALRNAKNYANVILIAIAGRDPTQASLDSATSYAFDSFRRVYSQYGIVAVPVPDPRTQSDVDGICGGPLRYSPLLYVVMKIESAGQNKYTSGYSTTVDLTGNLELCQPFPALSHLGPEQSKPTNASGKAAASPTPTSTPNFEIVPVGNAYPGHWAQVYYANPFSGLMTVFALSTSPWITKYKIWINAPATLVSSFEHPTDAGNGTVYCAVANLVVSQMMDLPHVTDNANLIIEPRWPIGDQRFDQNGPRAAGPNQNTNAILCHNNKHSIWRYLTLP